MKKIHFFLRKHNPKKGERKQYHNEIKQQRNHAQSYSMVVYNL